MMRHSARALIAGCGYVGGALAAQMTAAGHMVYGLRRTPGALPIGVRPWLADLARPDTLREPPSTFDTLVYAVGAEAFTEDAYRMAYVDGLEHLLDALERVAELPRRIVFTSSTGVYGESDGAWLDEDSPTAPRGFSGTVLLEAEDLLQARTPHAVVVRLGGIYGPGRTRLIEQVRQGEAQCVEGRTAYLNLVHRDDAAGMLAHILTLDTPAPLYLGVDGQPVERCALLQWIAAELGVPAPPTVPGADAPRQRGGNRRFTNARLMATGYTFRFPDYRAGYAPLLH